MTIAEPQIQTVGVHRNIPETSYHGSDLWRLPSASLLKTLHASTPAHARYAQTHYTPPTPALVEGQALHTLALEPLRFEDRFWKASACCATVAKTGNPCTSPGIFEGSGGFFCGVHGKGLRTPTDRQMLTADQLAKVTRMNEALFSHPEASDIIGLCRDKELSIVFERDGIRAKARMDLRDDRSGIVADIKSTGSAAPDEVEKTIENFGYHIQAGFYGVAHEEAFGVEMSHFVFIFVEKDPPYAVAVYELEPEAISDGRAIALDLLHRWNECEKKNEFPCYPGYRTIGRPRWARRT